jgi:sporulation protein YlmC with PRC-barrel domain
MPRSTAILLASLFGCVLVCTVAQAQSPSAGGSPPDAATKGGDSAPATQPSGGPSDRSVFVHREQNDVFASNLIDLEVRNEQNQRLGEIEDLVLDNASVVKALVLGIGGYRGGNTRHIAVEASAVKLHRDGAGRWHALLNVTAEELNAAPDFPYESGWNER